MPTEKNVKATADFTSILKEMSKIIKGWNQVATAQIQANKGADALTKKIDAQTKALTRLATENKKLNTSYRDLVNQQKAVARQTVRTTAEMKKQAAQQSKQIKLSSDFVQKGLTQREFQKRGATFGEVFDYKTSISRLKELQKQHRVSHAQIKKMWGELARGDIVAYTGAQRRVRDQLIKIRKAQAALGTQAKKTAVAFRQQADAEAAAFVAANKRINVTNKDLGRMRKGVEELTISWKSFIRLLAVQLFHQAVSLFVRQVRDGIVATIELEKRIAEVQTISQNQPLIFEEWRKGLLAVSDAWGLPILDTVEGAYQALSNQIAEGTEALRFMTEASQFAVTTVASTADSVNLLTATLNAFNLTVDDTEAVAASFFKTIELGRVRASEMANTFGRIAVPAEKLGIQLNELQAAISSATIQGLKYNEAATLIRNVLLKLIRPTDAMKRLFAEWGVVSGEAAIQTFGFAGVLAKIEEASQGSSTELGELFGRIRAITGAMLFAGEGLKRYQENLEEINRSTETYNERTAIIMENTGKRLEVELNKISNFFLELGDRFLRNVENIRGGFGTLTSAVRVFTKTMANLLVPAVLLATKALITFIATSQKAWLVFSRFGGIFLFAVAIQIFFERWLKRIEDINATVLENQENWHKERIKQITKERDEQIKAIKDANRIVFQQLARRISITELSLKAEKKAYQGYTDFVKSVGSATAKAIGKQIREIRNEIKRLDSLISTADFARGLRSTIDQTVIERRLSGADAGVEPTKAAKFAFLQAALITAQEKARTAAIRGQEKEFDAMNKMVQSFAFQALAVNDVMEQGQKRIRNGALFIENVLRKQFTFREILSKFAEREKKEEDQKLLRLKTLQKRAADLTSALAEQQLELLDIEDASVLEAALRGQKHGLTELLKIARALGVEGFGAEALQLAQVNLRLATEQKILRLKATEEFNVLKRNEEIQVRTVKLQEAYNKLLSEAIDLTRTLGLKSRDLMNLFPEMVRRLAGPQGAENRQAGGHGIDTQMARISPSETVMNPAASRRFYSTLTAMNAGIQRFADGGAPVQYSVGDIHLHPQDASKVDVVSIGKGLRREIRRGRLRLN
jgi:TP901 family phage tail tape measure protein